jgi:hypothetical protein
MTENQDRMRSYLGQSRVLAMPMTREDAESRLGKELNEGFLLQEKRWDSVREQYTVYERWLPVDSFKGHFVPMESMSFGFALDTMFSPISRTGSRAVPVAREAWESGWVIGKNAPGKDGQFCRVWIGDATLPEDELCQPLTCEDMLANDWRVIENG